MGLDYKQAGVDIDKGDSLVPFYKKIAKKTAIPGVAGSLGGFASLFSLKELNCKDPLLVSGTDGVGTKLKLAIETGIHNTVGIDLVAMCVNDIITCGAKPLFFQDYFAAGELETEVTQAVVSGIGEGCLQAGCALVGGETAELPGMYAPGEYELAGFGVGVVDREKLIDGSKIKVGDVVIGVASSGFHSNGYSLVRKVVETKNLSLTEKYGFDCSLAEMLLAPTIIYARALTALMADCEVRGVAHITGGGLPGNACRMLPAGVDLELNKSSWDVPSIFEFIQEHGDIADEEMFRAFNMGLGLVVVVDKEQESAALASLRAAGQKPFSVGSVVAGDGKVVLL